MTGGGDHSGGARPGRTATLLLITLASLVVLVSAGRVWVEATYRRWAPLGEVQDALSGRDLQSVTTVLALLGLAGVGGLLASHGVMRRVIAVVVAVTGLAVAFLSVQVALDPLGALPSVTLADRPGKAGIAPDPVTSTLWPWLSALGGLAMTAGSGLAVVRSGTWPSWGAGARADQLRHAGPRQAAASSNAPGSPPEPGAAGRPGATEGSGAAGGSTATSPTASPDAWHAQDQGHDPTEHSHVQPDQPRPEPDLDPGRSP